MRFRVASMPIWVGVALGGAVILLAVWLSHPAARIPETQRLPPKPVSPPRETPPAQAESRDSLVPGNPVAALPAPRATEPIPAPAASPKPVSKIGPPGGHWDNLRYLQGISAGQGEAGCQEAIRRTATHLSIEAARVSEFEVAASKSVLEMKQALEVRKRELSTSAPSEGSSVLIEQERLSQERYAAARTKALDRLERFLAQSTVHQEFRWAFDSWASMVSTKTRGEDR